jgi:hypothetical protein
MVALIVHLSSKTRQQLEDLQKELKLTCLSDVIEDVVADYYGETVKDEDLPE